MALSTLPPELKLSITEQLDPTSSLNFALTSRDHSKLCQSNLRQHARLLSEWKIIDTAAGNSTLLWSFLKEVLEDPRKGWYVRELNLPGTRRYHWNRYHPRIQPLQLLSSLPETDQKIFKSAAQALRDLYPPINGEGKEEKPPKDLIAALEQRIASGFDDAIIAILIHHLPFLSTIRITTIETDCVQLLMNRIALAYKDPTRAPLLPFQHLTSAAVSHWDSELSCDADWACFFLCVPSLRTFVANAMGGETCFGGRDGYLPKGAPPISNVTELYFRRCQLEIGALEVILAGTIGLERLTYHGTSGITCEDWWYEPKKMIMATATHAGHSLEELVLDHNDHEEEYKTRAQERRQMVLSDRHMTELQQSRAAECDLRSISLRGFKKLKRLNCEWLALRPQDDEIYSINPIKRNFYTEDQAITKGFDVRTLLPESLEELDLHGSCDDDEWEQMTESLRVPNSAAPNLKRTFITRTETNWGMCEDVEWFGDPRPEATELTCAGKLLAGNGF